MMEYRNFGRTGLRVSELGFGGWAMGGLSFGAVQDAEALASLARAEELGCNFVDTAAVYGKSEQLIGKFLTGRRERWIIASKYSGQPQGIAKTLEVQLRALGTDVIDFYQLHWAPSGEGRRLYDELERLKSAGTIRFIGVSLYNAQDIDSVLDEERLDGIQVCLSLLDPTPLMSRLERVRARGAAVIVRSALHGGFLTGKYTRSSRFVDIHDQRHQWSAARIREAAANAERFQFLTEETGTMLSAALRYPLTLPEVSTVVLSTKSVGQATLNFSTSGGVVLSPAAMARITETQENLGLFATGWRGRVSALRRRLLSYWTSASSPPAAGSAR